MSYHSNYLKDAAQRAYSGLIELLSTALYPSGLELAIAGAPLPHKRAEMDLPYLMHSSLQSQNKYGKIKESRFGGPKLSRGNGEVKSLRVNFGSVSPVGNYLIFEYSGGKINLDPLGVKKDEEGYVKQKLKDTGIEFKSSEIKKIAQQLRNLKGEIEKSKK